MLLLSGWMNLSKIHHLHTHIPLCPPFLYIHSRRAFNRRLSIQFMEMTSNETNLASLAPSYLSKCDAVVYVYDSTDHK